MFISWKTGMCFEEFLKHLNKESIGEQRNFKKSFELLTEKIKDLFNRIPENNIYFYESPTSFTIGTGYLLKTNECYPTNVFTRFEYRKDYCKIHISDLSNNLFFDGIINL